MWLLLLLGCPKQAPSAPEVEVAAAERVEQLKAEAPFVERMRGVWRLAPTDAERAFIDACRAVLDGASPDDFDLPEPARTYVRARAAQPATAGFFRPIYADADAIGVLLRPDAYEWFAGSYVFEEGRYVLTETDAGADLALDGNTWHVAFVDVDHLQLSDDLGAFAKVVGHEGPITLERSP